MSLSGGQSPKESSLTPVFTLVLWTITCSISVIGVLVPYVRPHMPLRKEVTVTAEALQVQLTQEPVIQRPAELTSPPEAQPPDLRSVVQPIELPAFTAVADPAVVAFALPIEGPIRVVEAKVAAFASPAESPRTNAPVVAIPPPQQLTYGQGEGRQPAPEYPFKARREGQEGVVIVRFLVGEDGRVVSAEPSSSSPWPLLNSSAVRVVRERWRFAPGATRHYEVAIRFQLAR
jgi:protein TonB